MGGGGSPAFHVISHCFVKIAASDDGNFILPLYEAKSREGRRERKREQERCGAERGKEVRKNGVKGVKEGGKRGGKTKRYGKVPDRGEESRAGGKEGKKTNVWKKQVGKR